MQDKVVSEIFWIGQVKKLCELACSLCRSCNKTLQKFTLLELYLHLDLLVVGQRDALRLCFVLFIHNKYYERES